MFWIILYAISVVLSISSVVTAGIKSDGEMDSEAIIGLGIFSFVPLIQWVILIAVFGTLYSEHKEKKQKLFKKYNRFIQCGHCELHYREGHILENSFFLEERTCPGCEQPIGKNKSSIDIETNIDYSPIHTHEEVKNLHKLLSQNKNNHFANQQSEKFRQLRTKKIEEAHEKLHQEFEEYNKSRGGQQ